MIKFKVGDKVKRPDMDELYKIMEIDEISAIIPKYKVSKIKDNLEEFWDYCIGWKKLMAPDDVLRYGEILIDDNIMEDILDETGYNISDTNIIRIRIIRYESRIFYHKMINGGVVEFKELTV